MEWKIVHTIPQGHRMLTDFHHNSNIRQQQEMNAPVEYLKVCLVHQY